MNAAEQCIAARATGKYLATVNTRNASDTGSWWRTRFVAIARQAESAATLPRPHGAVRTPAGPGWRRRGPALRTCRLPNLKNPPWWFEAGNFPAFFVCGLCAKSL